MVWLVGAEVGEAAAEEGGAEDEQQVGEHLSTSIFPCISANSVAARHVKERAHCDITHATHAFDMFPVKFMRLKWSSLGGLRLTGGASVECKLPARNYQQDTN